MASGAHLWRAATPSSAPPTLSLLWTRRRPSPLPSATRTVTSRSTPTCRGPSAATVLGSSPRRSPASSGLPATSSGRRSSSSSGSPTTASSQPGRSGSTLHPPEPRLLDTGGLCGPAHPARLDAAGRAGQGGRGGRRPPSRGACEVPERAAGAEHGDHQGSAHPESGDRTADTGNRREAGLTVQSESGHGSTRTSRRVARHVRGRRSRRPSGRT